ncbi:MAG: four helix bundle protein [Phycisphaerae bacterium]|nr:four helix bundle protein [Phycisphaerae bacterium]
MGKAAESFEDLYIYQRARELANAVYKITKKNGFSRDFGLVDQIRRAAVSVLSNIAEGFERGSKTEFIQFLYIAKGSCGEVRAQLQIAQDQSYLQQDEYQGLYDLCKQINGMISNFIAHLQKTDYQGEKVNRPKRLALQKDKQRMDKFFASHGIKLPDYDQQ